MSQRSKFLRITSGDKTTTSENNGDFFVELKETYTTQRIKEIMVHSAIVPNVFYNIRSSQGEINNTLTFTELGQAETTVSVPEGQYTLTEFIAVLEPLMDAAMVGTTVVITQDPASKKLIFTFTGNTVTINNVSLISSVIGLINTPATGAVLTMDSIPNLRGYDEVYIHSSTIGPGNTIDANFGYVSSIINVPFNDAPFGAIAYYQSSVGAEDTIKYNIPIDLSVIKIVLRDAKGNRLDPGTHEIVFILKVFF